MERTRSTTILAVVKDGKAVMASDGQVSRGHSIVKHTAAKVRKLYDDKVLVGFAGSVADALTLAEKLESYLKEWDGQLVKAAVELTKEWRTDKFLRHLEASILATDGKVLLNISGNGDVLESDDKVISAIGSGGDYALSAAQALYCHTKLSANDIVKHSMKIAGDLCIYTNNNLTIMEL